MLSTLPRSLSSLDFTFLPMALSHEMISLIHKDCEHAIFIYFRLILYKPLPTPLSYSNSSYNPNSNQYCYKWKFRYYCSSKCYRVSHVSCGGGFVPTPAPPDVAYIYRDWPCVVTIKFDPLRCPTSLPRLVNLLP